MCRHATALLLACVLHAYVSQAVRLFSDGIASIPSTGAPFNPVLAIAEQDLNFLERSRVCVFVNGNICDCMDGTFSVSNYYWTESCVRAISRRTCAYASFLLADDPAAGVSASVVPRVVATTPIYYSTAGHHRITLVLPLTVDDIGRSAILLQSLSRMTPGVVEELLVFVPDGHLVLVRGAVLGLAAELRLPFPVRVLSELDLFHVEKTELQTMHPYAVQMAIKLLAAAYVSTPYYLTLDADILQLRPFDIGAVVVESSVTEQSEQAPGRAVYHWEERSVHESWWAGSERVLNISYTTSIAYQRWRYTDASSDTSDDVDIVITDSVGETQRRKQGFGVTPAILSTYGSQLTVFHLCRTLTHNFEYDRPIDFGECERRWLGDFGRVLRNGNSEGKEDDNVWLWSEYTLYRVALDHYQAIP
jgi:hypothetical protein